MHIISCGRFPSVKTFLAQDGNGKIRFIGTDNVSKLPQSGCVVEAQQQDDTPRKAPFPVHYNGQLWKNKHLLNYEVRQDI
ncbi:hypothetical protein T10_3035 [Trichinella papuae]|uniref:Uncharacterized protein n=1 Tax=Trichinella papuae TaxID=268474 RepID=A0A0V1MD13_9BILA|nr:hypothetical protein T10_5285 [Trichinella papuae]KRZ69723.1 hypothetical protein T10_3035 [Trichinella papuae]